MSKGGGFGIPLTVMQASAALYLSHGMNQYATSARLGKRLRRCFGLRRDFWSLLVVKVSRKLAARRQRPCESCGHLGQRTLEHCLPPNRVLHALQILEQLDLCIRGGKKRAVKAVNCTPQIPRDATCLVHRVKKATWGVPDASGLWRLFFCHRCKSALDTPPSLVRNSAVQQGLPDTVARQAQARLRHRLLNALVSGLRPSLGKQVKSLAINSTRFADLESFAPGHDTAATPVADAACFGQPTARSDMRPRQHSLRRDLRSPGLGAISDSMVSSQPALQQPNQRNHPALRAKPAQDGRQPRDSDAGTSLARFGFGLGDALALLEMERRRGMRVDWAVPGALEEPGMSPDGPSVRLDAILGGVLAAGTVEGSASTEEAQVKLASAARAHLDSDGSLTGSDDAAECRQVATLELLSGACLAGSCGEEDRGKGEAVAGKLLNLHQRCRQCVHWAVWGYESNDAALPRRKLHCKVPREALFSPLLFVLCGLFGVDMRMRVRAHKRQALGTRRRDK